jgi:hypothetical protein
LAQQWIKQSVTGVIAAIGFMAGVTGCNGSGTSSTVTSSAQIASEIEREEAWRGQIPPTLIEVTNPKGKLYVVGYPESAAKVKAGEKLKMEKKAFGFGPNGETVIFEDNKIGLADILIKDYQAKK